MTISEYTARYLPDRTRLMSIGLKLLVGIGLIGYGLYYLVMRKFAPEKLTKLQSMMDEFDTKKALTLHIIGYTVMPIVAGIFILVGHFRS